jgi:hypothetical protein
MVPESIEPAVSMVSHQEEQPVSPDATISTLVLSAELSAKDTVALAIEAMLNTSNNINNFFITTSFYKHPNTTKKISQKICHSYDDYQRVK